MTQTQEALPIDSYKSAIMRSIRDNPVTIITAETGAGKSTQVPQWLLEEGYQIVVTQPRRLAARTVALRVAEEAGSRLGDLVGYRTGGLNDHNFSMNTKALFVTDGLQLVREITGNGNTQVLVIDEVHEWNVNIETLVAWTRKELLAGSKLKVVLMSATVEAEKLSRFYSNAPVITVPGRLFPVTTSEDGGHSVVSNILDLVSQRRNVLVFQPGKKEIADTVEEVSRELSRFGSPAVVLPLHGELDPEEQQRCFEKHDLPTVIVATNVAQTSITIPFIDAVVDTGVERRIELRDGIEGLFLNPVSQADCMQRRGRAGRTKEGIYILCSDMPLAMRSEFPQAEIERVRLDQLVLRLASIGLDATTLEFFHQPQRETLLEAKRALIAMGAMEEDGSVTKIGRDINRLPISVQYGRMVVEAMSRNVLGDVITIAAILEAGSLKGRDPYEVWRHLTNEIKSDLLAELDFWKASQGKRAKEMREELGLNSKSVFKAREIRQKLVEVFREHRITVTSTGNRHEILMSCIAGMVDHLYQNVYGGYKNGGNTSRQLDKKSVVGAYSPWIVGLPRDIQFKDRYDNPRTLNLVSMITIVDPLWLVELAPHLAGRIQKAKNEELLRRWVNENYELKISAPDSSNPSSRIPEVVVQVYGQDVLTGDDLVCYGTVEYFIGDFYTKWFQASEEAEKCRAKAAEALNRLKEERGISIAENTSSLGAALREALERNEKVNQQKEKATVADISSLAAHFNS